MPEPRRPSLISPQSRRLIDRLMMELDSRGDERTRTVLATTLGDFVTSEGVIAGERLPLSDAIPPTETFSATGTAGTSTAPSRGDHVHPMPVNPVTAHEAAPDPHTGYQKESEKSQASGYASLDSGTKVPTVELGTGSASSTVFLRGDRSWATPGAGSGGGHTIEDETTPVTNRGKLSFQGSSVAVTDDGANDRTVVTVSGGGSGNAVYTSAYASPPGSPASGDLWLPTDSKYVLRYSGSAWVPWGQLHPMTLPTDPGTWVNQGGASVTTAAGFLTLAAPIAGGNNWRVRVMTAPATPYTYTAYLKLVGTSSAQGGLCFRESGTGELHIFHLSATTLESTKFTNPTTLSASYTSSAVPQSSDLWLRIADNGTNRICSFSQDGTNFVVLHTIGRTDFLTADQIGISLNANSTSFACFLSVYSAATA